VTSPLQLVVGELSVTSYPPTCQPLQATSTPTVSIYGYFSK